MKQSVTIKKINCICKGGIQGGHDEVKAHNLLISFIVSCETLVRVTGVRSFVILLYNCSYFAQCLVHYIFMKVTFTEKNV